MERGIAMSLYSSASRITGPGASAGLLATIQPFATDTAPLMDWALAAIADSEKRIANLQARIDYLEGLSVTDELTGLYNRRGFSSQLDRALAIARRGGLQGALLMCDLDGFKQLNDCHGHAAGDEMLRHIARILARQVRRTDVAARLGGDEFAVLLVGASREGAARKAAILRELIAGSRVMFEGRELTVGISIGCVSYTGEESDDGLLRHADKAMYAVKRRARQSGRRGRAARPVVIASAA